MKKEAISQLTTTLDNFTKHLCECNTKGKQFYLYTNETLRELLQVEDKLIRKYRESGDLAYCQVGNKYWYTQADVEEFLSKNHYSI